MTEGQPPPDDTRQSMLSPELLHDLRTPINHIIGYSEMLAEQAAAEGQNGSMPDLQKIRSAGHHLLALVNDSGPSLLNTVCSERGPGKDSLVNIPQTEPPTAVVEDLALGAIGALILVVDDNEMNRDVLSRHLERQGNRVVLAPSGKEALAAVQVHAFDLILLDILMPDMDGYAVLQQLKADTALRHIPVIMISELDELDSIVRCIKMGAEDYLPKPYNPILLRARISACVEQKRARDRDIADYKQAEEASVRLASVVEALDDAIINWTLDGVITAWNRGAVKMYGYTAAEILGLSVAMLLPPNHADYEAVLLNPIKRGDLVNQIETVCLRKDSSVINISLVVSPVRNGSGTVTGGWAIARDITSRKQNEVELTAAKVSAEAANRAKSEFLATMSHELRTPLNGVIGMTELLLGTALTNEQQDLTTMAHESGHILLTLLNDILDFSKIEAGKLELEVADMDLRALVEDTVETLMPRVLQKRSRSTCL